MEHDEIERLVLMAVMDRRYTPNAVHAWICTQVPEGSKPPSPGEVTSVVLDLLDRGRVLVTSDRRLVPADPAPFRALLHGVEKVHTNVQTAIDRPDRPEDRWFVDFTVEGHEVNVEWVPERGFGLSCTEPAHTHPFEGPHELYSEPEHAGARVIDLLAFRLRTRPRIPLEGLRRLSELRQRQVAERLGVTQPSVSKMETKPSLPRLRRYVEALGGVLEGALVRLGPDEYLIDLPPPTEGED